MGLFINVGNQGFRDSRSGRFVDKSELISLINAVIHTEDKLVCVSRPRRFGKTVAAKMLCAYYDCSCDSSALFDDLEIASAPDYRAHLNQYYVLYLDMTVFTKYGSDCVKKLQSDICGELGSLFPCADKAQSLEESLLSIVERQSRKFIAVIDEWDAPIRELSELPRIKEEYLHFLRSLFKNSSLTDRIFAGAYMTGILPIKKLKSESAISSFREYTFMSPGKFAPYFGFTESEVRTLCERNNVRFSGMKEWYDGYSLMTEDPDFSAVPVIANHRGDGSGAVSQCHDGTLSVYNPNSVMTAITKRAFDSYWVQTAMAENLLRYIDCNFDGLGDAVVQLIAGEELYINTVSFDNDISDFRCKDDVLTLLVHLGYLSYDFRKKTVRIPNLEIRMQFETSVKFSSHRETIARVIESDRLIEDTLAMRETAVAAAIEKVHRSETAPLFYNSEQALRLVIKLAYFCYRDRFLCFEELPSGDGYADLVFFPKNPVNTPTVVVELKRDHSAEGAIAQILNKKYPDRLTAYSSQILLVGISYDSETKKHTCKIQPYLTE